MTRKPRTALIVFPDLTTTQYFGMSTEGYVQARRFLVLLGRLEEGERLRGDNYGVETVRLANSLVDTNKTIYNEVVREDTPVRAPSGFIANFLRKKIEP